MKILTKGQSVTSGHSWGTWLICLLMQRHVVQLPQSHFSPSCRNPNMQLAMEEGIELKRERYILREREGEEREKERKRKRENKEEGETETQRETYTYLGQFVIICI